MSCASQSRISTLLRIYPRTLSTKDLASVSGLPPPHGGSLPLVDAGELRFASVLTPLDRQPPVYAAGPHVVPTMTKSAGTVAVSMPHCQFEMSYPVHTAIAAGATAMEWETMSAVSNLRHCRREFMCLCLSLPLLRMFNSSRVPCPYRPP